MSVSDLTGTTWLINDTITEPANNIYAYINFVSNSANFLEIKIYDGSEPGTEQCIKYTTQDRDTVFAYEHGWANEAYRTITITGGEGATNSSLIAWLENNATQVVQTRDVIVSYAGADIATMSDSGTKTLKTQGKYCTDDITIEYMKPSGGGGGGSPKKFVMRPDAELVQSYSADYLAVADKGKTLPSYSTSSQLIVASANLSPKISIDFTNYDYFVIMRGLAIPQYNTTTKQKGRCDYTATSYVYELLVTPANDAHTIDGTKSYSSSSAAVVAHGFAFRELFWTSETTIGIGTSSAPYGVYAMGTAPAISGSTLIIKSPACAIRGHSSYMTSGAWSTMTDIRYQWIIEVWKAPITEVAGWEHTNAIRAIFADVRDGGDLT